MWTKEANTKTHKHTQRRLQKPNTHTQKSMKKINVEWNRYENEELVYKAKLKME